MTKSRNTTYLNALLEAQKWAISPFVFKAISVALKTKLLQEVVDHPGLSVSTYAEKTQLSDYAIRCLIDLLVPAGFFVRGENDTLSATKVADIFVYDDLTQANFLFTDDVNYAGLEHMFDALLEEKPAGLSVFDPSWKTIYPHLPELPKDAQASWFKFDHFYSDAAYRAALKVIENISHQTMVDIGGNTGKFTRLFLETYPKSTAYFVDLPVQTDALPHRPEMQHVIDRVTTCPIDWLTDSPLINVQADLFWMSQFLDCFSFEEAKSILLRVKDTMHQSPFKNVRLVVLEPIVDEQRHLAAELSIAATSLYFAVMANGNSRFFNGAVLRRLFDEAGFEIESEHPNLGVSHTLFILKIKDA